MHGQLTNNLTKYGIDLCTEFVKMFKNKTGGMNHCLLLKKVAIKFIGEGIKAINIGSHINTRKICIKSSVDVLKRNINVLSAYFVRDKTFNKMNKEDMKTFLGQFFDGDGDILKVDETNKVAQIIKDGKDKIKTTGATKFTEVKEVEDLLEEFEQLREIFSDEIGNETDIIYDQSAILNFINRLNKVDLYLINHINVLKGAAIDSVIDFDILESSETTEGKESQKIKHPRTGEEKDKKEETKTSEDAKEAKEETKEPEKIRLSKTKISIIVVGSLLILVILVIVGIIVFKKYKKGRRASNNFINLENTLSMYVTNEE